MFRDKRPKELLKKLDGVKADLKKYSHVNKKAIDQYIHIRSLTHAARIHLLTAHARMLALARTHASSYMARMHTQRYMNFTEQREQLLLRKEELDKGALAIRELIEVWVCVFACVRACACTRVCTHTHVCVVPDEELCIKLCIDEGLCIELCGFAILSAIVRAHRLMRVCICEHAHACIGA